MRVAVIDLGTNTFHLLIVEVSEKSIFTNLYEEKAPARIGADGISKGIIGEQAFERGINIIIDLSEKINESGVAKDKIFAAGTSAIRNAANGEAFVNEIFNKTGIQVEIINGEREAELIYRGVKNAVKLGMQPVLIMDIGGGSVEFIIGNEEKVFWKKSFEIGGQRLIDKFMTSDPMPPANVEKMIEFLEATLIPLTDAVYEYKPKTLVGAAGTFDTLVEIYHKEDNPDFDISLQTEYGLPIPSFYMIYQSLLYLNREQRLQIPGMIALRADMIVVACCLLNFVMQKYDISTLKTATYALKEGLLAEKQLQTN
ncbi:MAG: phosphatase [Verrucomicrobia bacterium]|nr:phosphatase [Cytophagales bacterium]